MTQIVATYHACIPLGVASAVAGNFEDAEHYFRVAKDCREIAGVRYGGYDKGHGTARDIIVSEYKNVSEAAFYNKTATFKFVNKCLIDEAVAGGVVVPPKFFPS